MSRIVQESDADAVQAHMGDKNACVRLGSCLNNLEAVCSDVCKVLEDKKPESVHNPKTVQAGDNGETVVPEVKIEAPQAKDGLKAEVQQVGDSAETKASEVKMEPLQVINGAEARASESKSDVVQNDAVEELVPMEE
jgi:hypothetical protein